MKIVHIPAILLLVGLAGCSVFSSESTAKAAPGTVLRECQDAAEADRSLNAYAAENAAGVGKANDYDALLKGLRQNSVDTCLQRRGAQTRGGVERVR